MVPKRRKSRTRTRTRRSHHAIGRRNSAACPRCSAAKLPHCACVNCGYVSKNVALAVKTEES